MSARLRRSKDRKVSNSVTQKGNARGANAFGLPAGADFSCPGATELCSKICYAGKAEKMYFNVHSLVIDNYNLLKDATEDEQYDLIYDMIDEFNVETIKANAKGLTSTYDFRIHWDGDFFNESYARAWARVIVEFPNITFWAYTRSFFVAPVFEGIDNLALYLSIDRHNVAEAKQVAAEYPYVKLAGLGKTFKEAQEVLDTEDKTYQCPENAKRMPLITPKGSACISCGICPSKRGNVTFSISQK